MSYNNYESPLSVRYASSEMSNTFSPIFKYSTWRQLWVALAEAESELGLPVSKHQIEELSRHIHTIDFTVADKYEKELQHDVMAHIQAYGDQCPVARPIIHLGATSCFVTDNGDLIQMRQGFQLLLSKLKTIIQQLSQFAAEYAHLPCLAFTHFQSAQLTTVGKRACMWLQDLFLDFQELSMRTENLCFLGTKGATGTQASFLALFDGDVSRVEELDQLVAKKMGFSKIFPISGQTYTRKQDVYVLNALAGIAISAHKFASDLRLLAHLKEMEEGFAEKQVGSSAMPYKRNPILSERICSLSRFLLSLNENPAYTASTQWFERTLDDSANRRLVLPEAFLTCDAILSLLSTVITHWQVHPKVIARHVAEELPFLATENILMACVKKGGDRQDLHEKLKMHSFTTRKRIAEEGESNDLLEKIADDPAFPLSSEEIHAIVDEKHFIGLAPQQVDHFLELVCV